MHLKIIETEISLMDTRWYKLLLVSGSTGEEMAKKLGITYINLNLILSERLRNITKSKYPLYVGEILNRYFEEENQDTFWLGDIELLFDKQLQQNPVRLLENISKRYKLIVSWPGESNDKGLSYATPEHPEFFTCDETDGKILSL